MFPESLKDKTTMQPIQTITVTAVRPCISLLPVRLARAVLGNCGVISQLFVFFKLEQAIGEPFDRGRPNVVLFRFRLGHTDEGGRVAALILQTGKDGEHFLELSDQRGVVLVALIGLVHAGLRCSFG